MARYCWAKREPFGSQTENLHCVRGPYRSEVRSTIATTCDRGWYRTCDIGSGLTASHTGAIKDLVRKSLWVPERGHRGERTQVYFDELMSLKFLSDSRWKVLLRPKSENQVNAQL